MGVEVIGSLVNCGLCMCILGRVLVPGVWGLCNDQLSLKAANIVSGRYTYTTGGLGATDGALAA